ncbi:MAG: hypothetical protein HYZ51_05085 [Candidatus Doudnabacteria bacterium]|nr:hypothetical protein [Candidatus Doudnabacteria bacterium]
MNILLKLKVKLKDKIHSHFGRILRPRSVFGVILLFLLTCNLFFYVVPSKVLAASYGTDQVTFIMDTQVPGASSSNYSNGNFIKLVQGKDLVIRVVFKLTGPGAGLNVNSDPSKADSLNYGSETATITGLGIEARAVNDPTNSNSGANTSIAPAVNSYLTNQAVKANEAKSFDFTIPWSKVTSSLNLTNNGFGSNTPNFLVAPVLKLSGSSGFWSAFRAGLGGGRGAAAILSNNGALFEPQKRVFVKIYPNQATADADKSAPSDVPGYGGVSGQVQSAPPSGITKFINELFTTIAQFFINLTYSLFASVLAPMLEGILSIRTYRDGFVNVIYPGWEILRNVSNIYFIVAIIAIAMGTLFRVESYKFRHLLVQLIIAALTVNFSLIIGQAVLGVADTAQNQFLPNNTEVIRQLGRDLMPARIQEIVNSNPLAKNSFFASSITTLFLTSMAFGAFLVFAAILVYLVIRIVMLWILLMLSPLAYAAGVLPSTANLRGKWWGEFLKYAFFTPIMGFFLNMAALIAVNYEYVFADITTNLAGGSNFGTLILAVASNILLLVFLFAAINLAQSFSIFGANVVDGIFKAGVFAPFVATGAAAGLAGKGAKLAGEKAGGFIKKHYDKRTSEWANADGWRRQAFKVAHPVAFVKGILEEGKKERELYKTRVEAGATEVARKQFGWRRKTESPMFLFDEHKGKELFEEEEGEWSDNEQQVIGIGNRLVADALKGDLRASIKLKHWFTEAFRHRNLNEALEGDNGMANKLFDHKLNYNSNNLRYFFQELMKKGVIDENFTGEFLKKLGKDGYETGDFNGVELVYSDPKTGHPHMIEMEYAGNGDALPKGWNAYVTKREQLIDQADTEGRAAAFVNPKYRDPATGLITPTDEQVGVETEKRLSKLENDWASEHHDYENAMHAERNRRYMKINMSKKTGTDQVRMFHDSIVNVGVEDGQVRISDAGTEVLGQMDAGKMYAMGRDNMPKKTRDKFMKYVDLVIKNETSGLQKIEDDLTTIIKAKYRELGVKVDPAQLKKEVNEQRNYWLAAGYSILSSKPGPTVAETMKALPGETIAATDQRVRDNLIKEIKVYKK